MSGVKCRSGHVHGSIVAAAACDQSAPKPTDRTLADMWESYATAVIPPGESAAAIRHMKFAFYGGASYVLDLVLAMADDDVSETAGVERLAALNRELHVFAAQEQARLKPGN